MSEDQLQATIWEKAWNEYPESRRCMWAVPNGFKMNKVEAGQAKATGLLSGVWDIHLLWKNQFYIFELKVGSNQLTRDRVVKGRKVYGQKEWEEIMVSHGAKSYIIRSVEQFFSIFHVIIKTTTP